MDVAAFAFRDVARYVTSFEQDLSGQARDLYLALPETARDASQADLKALGEACAFGTDYPQIAARAEWYFA